MNSLERLCFEKKALEHPPHMGVPSNVFPHIQLCRHSEATVTVVQGISSTAGFSSRPWCHPRDIDCADIQNLRVGDCRGCHQESRDRPWMPGSVWHGWNALWAALETEMHESMKVKLKLNGDPKKSEMPRL